jgi:penicillin G amidase
MTLNGVRNNTLVVGLLVLSSGCARDSGQLRAIAAPTDARLPQTSGTLQVPGLTDEVRIVRDHWGIPHIYARNADDLFFAQGFVQAQDRLFQIDLWRRSTQGRLAEILGADYVDRDRLTRLMRYRGDMNAEWASYAPDTRRIATRFVAGINAEIAAIGEQLPEEFAVAGYRPEPWQPEDLLSRAEGFVMTSNANDEVFRSRVTAAIGVKQANLLLPLDPAIEAPAPSGIDLSAVDATVRPALAAIGAPARFGSAKELVAALLDGQRRAAREGSNNWVIAGAKSATGKPLLANDPHRNLDHPSLRYLVHLNAPGWNVIGSVVPWFPGVAVGHNDRIAWGLTIFAADVQDLYVEELNPRNPRQVKSGGRFVDMEAVQDQIRVKGRAEAVAVEHFYTAHGPVVATDPQRHLAYALRWVGSEPGTAGYLGALSLDRATNWQEFRSALERWKVPGENFVYADVDGNIGYQAAALVPVRRNWQGVYPVAGATGEHEWQGWRTLDDLPHEFNPGSGYLATANNNTLGSGSPPNIGYSSWTPPARINRIREVLSGKNALTVDDLARLQHDATPWKAEQLVPLLQPLSFEDPTTEKARTLLIEWDRRLARDSAASTLYVAWERALFRQLIEPHLDPTLAADYVRNVETHVLVPALTQPSAAWFGASPARGRDQLLESGLAAAVASLSQTLGSDMTRWIWGQIHTATFQHALAPTSDAARLRFNVGPFPRAGYGDTVFATGGSGASQTDGATFREVMDVADWDRSIGTSAPGQSGQPGSPHFDDLAKLWAAEQYFPYSFSQALVEKNAEATLVLQPRQTLSVQQPPGRRVTAYTLPPDLYRQAHALGRIAFWSQLGAFFYSVIVLLLLLKWNVAAKIRDWAERLAAVHFLQALIVAPLFFITFDFLSLPPGVLRQWVIRKYGLSIQGWGSWFWDWTKGELITAVIATILCWVLYGAIRKSPHRWWLYFWAAALPSGMVFFFLTPLVIDPMFNTFEPLAQKDPALTARLEQMVQHAGEDIPAERMFWMGASEKLTLLNAYVTGLGASKRVVVWDTTIAKMTTPQVVFVVGHEMGHYALQHIWKGIAILAPSLLLFFYLASRSVRWMLAHWGGSWRIRGVGDWASLPALVLLLTVFSFVTNPIANAFSRYFEHQADQYGLEVTHGLTRDSGQIAAQTFQVLGEVALADPDPDSLDILLFYDHPAIRDRVQFSLEYDPWSHGEPPEFVK